MNTSSINFKSVDSVPELADAGRMVQEWIESKPTLQFFTLDQLAFDLGHRTSMEFIQRVILRLVAAGELSVGYRVKFDEGEYSEKLFDSLEEIPPCVFDSAFEPVQVSADNKVPSYSAG